MFTDKDLELIIKLRNGGMSLDQVAKLLVTDRLTIRKAESRYLREKRATHGSK